MLLGFGFDSVAGTEVCNFDKDYRQRLVEGAMPA